MIENFLINLFKHDIKTCDNFGNIATSWGGDTQLVAYTARKTIFPKSWNIIKSSKRPSKYHIFISLLGEKSPYFPSPKRSKQEVFSNQ